ncbi:MAG: hypothetical protein R3F34_06005 [Planctomycetota bacterium]
MTPQYRRRRFRLLRPALQLRLMAAFGGVALLMLGLQFMLFYRALGDAATRMSSTDATVVKDLSSSLVQTLLVSALVLLPAVLAVGTSVVLRFVGPLYRFENFLKEVLAGRDPGPCRLRNGDDLQELCELIDKVARPMRERSRREREERREEEVTTERTAA